MSDWPVAPRGYYLAPDGSELTTEEWMGLFQARRDDMSNDSWWRRRTEISGEIEVSTVWLGLNHSFGLGRPLYWETMIFGGEHDQEQWRYSSRQSALDDHERIVRALRGGRSPNA
jgi:hypothetical protein